MQRRQHYRGIRTFTLCIQRAADEIFLNCVYDGVVAKCSSPCVNSLSLLAVGEASFKPHQQLGHSGAAQPWAFIPNVTRLHSGCKTVLVFFLILQLCCWLELQRFFVFVFNMITVWTKWESDWADFENGGKSLFCGTGGFRLSHRAGLPDGASGQNQGGNEVV